MTSTEDPARELIDCPRCGIRVDVTRPGGTPLILGTDDQFGEHSVFKVRAGREELHRCESEPDATRVVT